MLVLSDQVEQAALARNFLNNLALGKQILPIIVFQGGVATNAGMARVFEEVLGQEVVVPPHHGVMGAIGAALLAHEYMARDGGSTRFKGFEVSQVAYRPRSFECKGCSNLCEVVEIRAERQVLARPHSPRSPWPSTSLLPAAATNSSTGCPFS